MTTPITLASGRVIGAVWHLDPPGVWRAIHDRSGHVVTCSTREYAERLVTAMETASIAGDSLPGSTLPRGRFPATEAPDDPASDGAHAGRVGGSTLRSGTDGHAGAPAAPATLSGR